MRQCFTHGKAEFEYPDLAGKKRGDNIRCRLRFSTEFQRHIQSLLMVRPQVVQTAMHPPERVIVRWQHQDILRDVPELVEALEIVA